MIIELPTDVDVPDNGDRYYERVILPCYSDRNDIVKMQEGMCNFDIDLFGKEVVNGYHSVYNLCPEIAKHVEATGSIRNYCGKISADFLHWDMDDSDNIQNAYDDTNTIIERLESMGANLGSVTICVSGGKGFHVLYRTEDISNVGARKNLHHIVKHVCEDIAEGLESWDQSVYDKTRVIRALNSKHAKTKKYKVPFSVREFQSNSWQELMRIATKQKEGWETEADSSVEYVCDLIEAKMSESESKQELTRKYSSGSMLEYLRNGAPAGDTNNFLASYAGIMRRRNYDNEFMYLSLVLANANCERPLPDKELHTIVNSISKYKVDDQYIDPEDSEITTMRQNLERYKEIASKTVNINTPFTHFNPILSGLFIGQVMLVIARPGVGKTLSTLKIGLEFSRELNEYALFISLEMDKSSVGFRAAQCEFSKTLEDDGLDNSQVRHQVLNNADFVDKTASTWEHMLTVDKTLRSIDSIKKYYHKAQTLAPVKIGVVVIDYMQLMSGSGDRAELDLISTGLKSLGKELQCRVIACAQVNRSAGDDSIRPNLQNIKNMGALEDSCDVCVAMWNDSEDENRVHNEVIKAREGGKGTKWDYIQRGMAYKSVDFFEAKPASENSTQWGR